MHRGYQSRELRDKRTLIFILIAFFACPFRPTQYGPDVVGIISKLFNSFEEGSLGTSPEVAETAIYLGLEALKSLCEAEVVYRFILRLSREATD